MFNWDKIDTWEKFERLSLYLVDEELGLNTFNLFLRRGFKQDGIDLKGFDIQSGRYKCVQCKKVKELSLKDLKEIVRLFRNGRFFSQSDKFIITTTADTTDKKIEKFITDQKFEFRTNGIQFEYWDKVKIEEKLVKYPRVVEYFFSLQDSVDHCFKPQVPPPNFSEIPVYIDRKIRPLYARESGDIYAFFNRRQEESDLLSLLSPLDIETPRICLLADPLNGKTSILRQVAFLLSELPVRIIPVFVELKNTVLQPISEMLNTYHPYWRHQPLSSLCIILDGVDEVSGQDFIKCAQYIDAFAIQYPTVSIVLACRTLFYYRYRLSQTLTHFKFHEMVGISSDDIRLYLDRKLKTKSKAFENAAMQLGVWELLYEPFFLSYLTELYQTPGSIMPGSRVEALDHCVEHSLENSKFRQPTQGVLLEHEVVVYKKALKRLAFALQMASRNTFNEEEMQELFSFKELSILQQGSLVNRIGLNWSFHLALFQEHLAGGVLASLEFEEIKSLITIGNRITKIKTKWVQTLASSLSILDKGNPTRTSLLALVEQDNLELLTLAEPDQFTSEEKVDIVRKIIDRYAKNNTRPIFNDVGSNNIGGFCKGDVAVIDYLLSVLGDLDNVRVKHTIWEILQYSSPAQTLKDRIYTLALAEIRKLKDGYYAKQILETVTDLHFGDENFVSKCLENASMISDHNYRDGLYELIISLNLVDKYYSFGLDGYSALFEYNRQITHSHSEATLEDFLLATSSPVNLRKLLLRITNEDWQIFYQYKSISAGRFATKLVDSLIKGYKADQILIISIVAFFRILVSKHNLKPFAVLQTFFDRTNTRLLAIKLLFLEKNRSSHWELFSIIDESCFDYIAFLCEESLINIHDLRTIEGGLRGFHSPELADSFHLFLDEMMEGQYSQKPDLQNIAYQKNSELKLANDKKHIQSLENFKEAVSEFFSAFGKQIAGADDLFIDHDARRQRRESSSNFVYHFLIDRLSKQNTVSLANCLKKLDQPGYFEDFRAYQILYYHYSPVEVPELVEILKCYYEKYLPVTEFANAIYDINDDQIVEKRRPAIIATIFQRHKFVTPQICLADFLWIDRSHRNGNRSDLTKAILEAMDESTKQQLGLVISERIKSGIKNHEVLEGHLEVCRELKLDEVVPDILQLITSKKFKSYYLKDATIIYIALGGGIAPLVPVFSGITDFTMDYFWYLAAILGSDYDRLVKERLYACMEQANGNRTARIDAAARLAQMGEVPGFSYLMQFIRDERTSPLTVQNGFRLHNVDTDMALSAMQDLCYLILEKQDSTEYFFNLPGNLLIEILDGLASKSEEDLIKVDIFLQNSYERLISYYPNAKDLLWYAERNLEQFRKRESMAYEIKDIKKALDSLDI